MDDYDWPYQAPEERPPDPHEEEAIDALRTFFAERRDRVFYSRQIEVLHEDRWFHWVTNRALRTLIALGAIHSEEQDLRFGGTVTLMWHPSLRYHKRQAGRVVSLVEEYSNPDFGRALGHHGEAMVLDAFARKQFLLLGREVRAVGSRRWTSSAHDLDFVFQRDGVPYGVEVKNTLGYPDSDEIAVKVEMCRELHVRPILAVRMMPKSWINEIREQGGFSLILKYQLYPWGHLDLAKRVRGSLELPVDAPARISDGTMERLLRWHSALSP